MKFALLCLARAALPTFAAARCVTADDLVPGVTFKRQDGRSGLAKADGKTIEVDYAANSQTAWHDWRRTTLGIYDLAWGWTPTDEYYVGGGPGGSYTYKFAGKPPVPEARTSWKTTVSVVESQDIGIESGPIKTRYSFDVTYSFQDTKEANLSGCTYTILPVEATFTGKKGHYSRRWIYFPDLGFGLETRQTDHQTGEDRKLGLTALTPQG